MTTFKVPAREDVSPASQAAFDNLQKGLGMVPNLYAIMALSENALPRYLQFQGARIALNNKEKEAANLVISQVNGCQYCLGAHSFLGKMNGFTEEELIRLRQGSGTDPKLNALVALAKDITEKRGHVSGELVDAFFAAGYTQGALVDLVMLVSDKVAMNYLHNITNVPLDFPPAPALN